MTRLLSLLVSLGLISPSSSYAGQGLAPGGQTPSSRPPVIDVHTHITAEDGPRILDSLNIRYALVMGNRERWARIDGMANRLLPSLSFPCPGGRELFFGKVTCYDTGGPSSGHRLGSRRGPGRAHQGVWRGAAAVPRIGAG